MKTTHHQEGHQADASTAGTVAASEAVDRVGFTGDGADIAWVGLGELAAGIERELDRRRKRGGRRKAASRQLAAGRVGG